MAVALTAATAVALAAIGEEGGEGGEAILIDGKTNDNDVARKVMQQR